MKKAIMLFAFMFLLVGFVSAGSFTTNWQIEINGEEVDFGDETVTLYNGQSNSVRVTFTATEDAEDVQIRTKIIGTDILDHSENFDILNGSTYTKLLELDIPIEVPQGGYEMEISIESDIGEDSEESEAEILDSADLIDVAPGSLTFLHDGESHDFTLFNREEIVDILVGDPSSFSSNNGDLSFSLEYNHTFENVQPFEEILFSVTLEGNPNNFAFGIYQTGVSFIATNTNGDEDYERVDLIAVSTFCEDGAQGSGLEISHMDISNFDGDDLEWTLMDDIEIEVEVENNGDENIEDVIVELGFFNVDGNNFADDLYFFNSEEEEIYVGEIGDGDDAFVRFEFRVPADFQVGNYRLAIKSYSEDNEDTQCIDLADDFSEKFYEPIDVNQESDEGHFVIVDDIEIDPEIVSIGEEVTVRYTVFNIGDEDQERVMVGVTSEELGVDEEHEIIHGLDIGDSQDLVFDFTVPMDAEGGLYSLEFKTYYDFDNGIYREESEETWIGFVEVNQATTDVAITDIILNPSNPELGDNVTATAVVKNLGDSDTFITFNGGFSGPGWGGGSGTCPFCIYLPIGETYTHQISFTTSAYGEYTVSASVDSLVQDTDLSNNELSLTFMVEENTCPADFNADEIVNHLDLRILLGFWGQTINPGFEMKNTDFNADGTVNIPDLLELLTNWGQSIEIYDLNDDGTIDSKDLNIFRVFWDTNGTGQGNPDLNSDGIVNALDQQELLSNWGSC